jgi:TIR domain
MAGEKEPDPGRPDREGALRVFINYRREDVPDAAGRLYDALTARFGDTIFMDVDDIDPGLDFVEVINSAVASCDVLIAMIGPKWLTVKDSKGKPRLDRPQDFVRLEIEAALSRSVRVIPVLLHGVRMPTSDDVPDSLTSLTRKNAIEIDYSRWRDDVQRLVKTLEGLEREKAERPEARRAEAKQPAGRPDALPSRVAPASGAPTGGAVRTSVSERPRRRLGSVIVIGAFLALGTAAFLVFNLLRESPIDRAEQIRACLQAHGLSNAQDEFEEDSARVYASCEWPPPEYAQGDGYSEIRIETGPGPYATEASSGNSVDRMRATCNQIEVRYGFGKMGEYERLEPFTVSAGAVVDYMGREWTREAPYPYPEADEVVVVRNSSYGLESVRCV